MFCLPSPLSKRADETPVERSFSSRLAAPSEKEKDDRDSGAIIPADRCNEESGLVAFMLACGVENLALEIGVYSTGTVLIS